MTLIELRKLADAATQGEWMWDGNVCDYDDCNESPWLVDAKDSYPPILGGQIKCTNTANAAYIAAANPAAVISLIDQIQTLQAERDALAAKLVTLEADAERLNRIAWLIGSIFVHGNFKAETCNERELERLLRENGTFWDTLQDFDGAIDAAKGGQHEDA